MEASTETREERRDEQRADGQGGVGHVEEVAYRGETFACLVPL